MSRPKAVIFDYGNVLSQPQNDSDIQAMANVLVLDQSCFGDAYWQFRVAYDEAQLGPVAYWQAVAKAAHTTATPDHLESSWSVHS